MYTSCIHDTYFIQIHLSYIAIICSYKRFIKNSKTFPQIYKIQGIIVITFKHCFWCFSALHFSLLLSFVCFFNQQSLYILSSHLVRKSLVKKNWFVILNQEFIRRSQSILLSISQALKKSLWCLESSYVNLRYRYFSYFVFKQSSEIEMIVTGF